MNSRFCKLIVANYFPQQQIKVDNEKCFQNIVLFLLASWGREGEGNVPRSLLSSNPPCVFIRVLIRCSIFVPELGTKQDHIGVITHSLWLTIMPLKMKMNTKKKSQIWESIQNRAIIWYTLYYVCYSIFFKYLHTKKSIIRIIYWGSSSLCHPAASPNIAVVGYRFPQ